MIVKVDIINIDRINVLPSEFQFKKTFSVPTIRRINNNDL